MSFDVDILFKIAAIGIAIECAMMAKDDVSGARGGGHDDNACGSYHRSCDCN